MTRSKGLGRGNAPGSRRALQTANALRHAQATKARQPDAAPIVGPHLRRFQTPAHMAELRRRSTDHGGLMGHAAKTLDTLGPLLG